MSSNDSVVERRRRSSDLGGARPDDRDTVANGLSLAWIIHRCRWDVGAPLVGALAPPGLPWAAVGRPKGCPYSKSVAPHSTVESSGDAPGVITVECSATQQVRGP